MKFIILFSLIKKHHFFLQVGLRKCNKIIYSIVNMSLMLSKNTKLNCNVLSLVGNSVIQEKCVAYQCIYIEEL